jgi:hypothetical protein
MNLSIAPFDYTKFIGLRQTMLNLYSHRLQVLPLTNRALNNRAIARNLAAKRSIRSLSSLYRHRFDVITQRNLDLQRPQFGRDAAPIIHCRVLSRQFNSVLRVECTSVDAGDKKRTSLATKQIEWRLYVLEAHRSGKIVRAQWMSQCSF